MTALSCRPISVPVLFFAVNVPIVCAGFHVGEMVPVALSHHACDVPHSARRLTAVTAVASVRISGFRFIMRATVPDTCLTLCRATVQADTRWCVRAPFGRACARIRTCLSAGHRILDLPHLPFHHPALFFARLIPAGVSAQMMFDRIPSAAPVVIRSISITVIALPPDRDFAMFVVPCVSMFFSVWLCIPASSQRLCERIVRRSLRLRIRR